MTLYIRPTDALLAYVNPFLAVLSYLYIMFTRLHPLHTDLRKPCRFTNPFHYEPHPLCLLAAQELQAYIAACGELRADADQGKMFGVLVVEAEGGGLGYLAAYSGLLAGRNDHEFFVPPVFDAMRPDGYFKTHEAEITAINRRIDGLERSEEYVAARQEMCVLQGKHHEVLSDYRDKMALAKLQREAKRWCCKQHITPKHNSITPEEEAAMIRESQFMNAEYKRLKRRCADEEAPVKAKVEAFENEIGELKARRKRMSDALQRWLFSQYSMLNALGERKDLCAIFAETPQRVPPSGAGDCCAPKLLQYAYLNKLRPVCMAEFWWGRSPAHEVRHHGRYYPACRGKCLPILGHMLQGLEVEESGPEPAVTQPLEIVYDDEWLAVVNKPAGMKTVPGLSGGTSVVEEIRQRYPDRPEATPVHRLDMDTSGLIIVAFGMDTYRELQAQFARREVRKRYVALLDGVPRCPVHGKISLPLRPDPLDRPYQKVDYAAGKEAETEYIVIGSTGGVTRVALFPHTGRTHQLRVHCAHHDGLGVPIVGDRLYGHPGGRLCLHAEAITFVHPVTGRTMRFERKAEF